MSSLQYQAKTDTSVKDNLLLYIQLHWKELLIEAWALGTFMISAAIFTILIESTISPDHSILKKLFTGMAMGLTAICIIYSPWGRASGAHMNPAMSFTMLMLRKMDKYTAWLYITVQFIGGLLGLELVNLFFKERLMQTNINYVQTLPGPQGIFVAFIGEFIISFILILMVLFSSNEKSTRRYTGIFAGILITLFITFESPLSGMSMNPARTIASAFVAGNFHYIWLYFLAPVAGMLSAAFSWKWWICKKNTFHCGYHF
ncbi:MAG: aquaporin [Saprospiraceae bacterium]